MNKVISGKYGMLATQKKVFIVPMKTNAEQSSTTRIAILDVLRFIAAFLVMLYHYQGFIFKTTGENHFSYMKFGYLGVNFFFMLSGFVIISSAQNRSAFKFAMLRVVRLYPTFIICLTVTLSVLYFFHSSLPKTGTILLNALIINDYFDLTNVDDVFWTLQAELKFYVCIFCLILFSFISKYRIWLSVWLALAIVYFFTRQPFFLGWFISPAYSFNFIAGVAAYKLFKNPEDHYSRMVFIIALVFACMKSWTQIDGFCRIVTVSDRIIASFIILLFFVFFTFLPNLNRLIKPSKIAAALGGCSYPLYLIHSRAGLEFTGGIMDKMGVYPALIVTIFSVLTVSFLIHLYIEKPVLRRVRVLYK